MHTFTKPPSAWLDTLPFTEFAIYSTISQSTGYLPFFMLYGQEVPLPLNHALINPSDSTKLATTASLSINIAQNATTQSYKTNAPKVAKTIQNCIQNAKKKNLKTIAIPKKEL